MVDFTRPMFSNLTRVLVLSLCSVLVGCVAPRPSSPSLPSSRQHGVRGIPIHDATSSVYRVQSGDTLYSIARSHAVEVNDLVRLNSRIDPRDLAVGARLVVPSRKPKIRSIERWSR